MIKKRRQRRFHQIIDLYDVDKNLIYDDSFWVYTIKSIAKLIDMGILDGPRIIHGQDFNPGDTIVTVIDFSDIIVHTFDEDEKYVNAICLEVFSCKPFDYSKLLDYVMEVTNTKPSQVKKSIVKYNNLPRSK